MKHDVALMPGDGIGPEIVAEGVKVLDRVAELHGYGFDWHEYDNGAERYLESGELMPTETLKEIERKCESIYLGALGDPRVNPGILEKGILLKTRFYFDQYVNLRPVKLLNGVTGPLRDKGPEDIDFVVVRENTEDFYVGVGNKAEAGLSRHEMEIARSLYNVKFGLDIESDGSEIAYQIGVVSREGARRVIDYAFKLASRTGAEKVQAVDKANVLSDIYSLWREEVEGVARSYPGIDYEFMFVDAITMWFVKNPEWFKVVVTPNMFGDIITDLGAMLQGGLGYAPGGNINPSGISMFEPIHGSAPKYAGMNVANPMATIWAGALMLEELGHSESKDLVVDALQDVLVDGKVRSKDMGGSHGTDAVGDAVVAKVDVLYHEGARA